MKENLVQVWNPGGNRTHFITPTERLQVKALQALMPLVPEDYTFVVSGKKLPVAKILFEQPAVPENSELKLDF